MKIINYKGKLQVFVLLVVLTVMSCSKAKDLINDSVLENKDNNSIAMMANFTDYYWYKGAKVPLQKNDNKKYILFEASNATTVSESINKEGVRFIEKIQTLRLPATVVNVNSKFKNTELQWAIIEDAANILEKNASIIYEAPFFSNANGDDFKKPV